MRGASLIGTSWRCTSATSFLWCVERLRHLEGGRSSRLHQRRVLPLRRAGGGVELSSLLRAEDASVLSNDQRQDENDDVQHQPFDESSRQQPEADVLRLWLWV